MELGCARADCTVAETGTCLLNHEPSSCPDRIAAAEPTTESSSAFVVPSKISFPGSRARTLSDARTLMEEQYVHLIGILGEPNAGKTGCLVSLYLSVTHRRLDGFSFANSRTLMGLEEISQGARQWNQGQIPDQFTDHTELADDRTAGFLHIKLARTQHGNSVDLLFSDLPGEWTTALIDQNRVDRLAFLRRADVIWLVVDGTELVEPSKRQLCIRRTRLAIGRLGNFLDVRPRLILVITRKDEKVPNESVVGDLCREGTQHGFETEAVEVASFSKNEDVDAGTGIPTLIERSTTFGRDCGPVWQQDDGDASLDFLKIGLVRRGTDDA